MAEITAANVKNLRDRTGAGMMDAKAALVEASGDVEMAIEILRKKGQAKATKKAGRATSEGLVESYIHAGGGLGVLIEVNCESDFVARTDTFKDLVHSLAMHVAAARPTYLTPEDVPADVLAKEKEIYTAEAMNQNKPADIAAKIAEGKVQSFYKDNCLMLQNFVKEPEHTVQEVIVAAIARIGENIRISRFARFQLGE